MKIALFGGSFNPIGTHHIHVANIVSNYVDQVLILPCYNSYHGKTLMEGQHRLAMCQIAVDENKNDKIKVCDFEIKHQMKAVNNKQILGKSSEDNSYYFVVGADNCNGSWIADIQQAHPNLIFIVVSRNGYETDENAWYNKPPHIFLKNVKVSGSSTELKTEYKLSGNSALINSKVLEYAVKNLIL